MPETATRSRKPKAAKPEPSVIEPQRILELGNGLELWKVHPSALREQDINARAMSKPMFERLARTIARDKRLESLPLCAKTDRGLEIISGHHRVRAATAAGLQEMFILADTTGLSRSQIAAKQLAHNAIEGEDNEQLLAEIYRQIEDAESKLEAFIDAKLDIELPEVRIENLDVQLDFKSVLLLFLPRVKQRLDLALEYIRSSGQKLDGVYVAADTDYASLEKAVRKINEEYDVRVVADIIGKMADLALQACGESVSDPERENLRDIFGTSWVPKAAGSVIRDAIKKMVAAGDVGHTNRWQALEYWAAEYLSKA
ncbi:MAG: ParB N-terminal domain-containing protein [Terriglobia bacterium]|jgi:ParB-like chromosome segregation protein Spo0J